MTTCTFYVNGEYKTIQADTEEEATKEARIKKDDVNSLPEVDSFDDEYPLLSQPLCFVCFFAGIECPFVRGVPYAYRCMSK